MNVVDLAIGAIVAMLRCVWATVVTVVPCRLVGWARAPSKMV